MFDWLQYNLFNFISLGIAKDKIKTALEGRLKTIKFYTHLNFT